MLQALLGCKKAIKIFEKHNQLQIQEDSYDDGYQGFVQPTRIIQWDKTSRFYNIIKLIIFTISCWAIIYYTGKPGCGFWCVQIHEWKKRYKIHSVKAEKNVTFDSVPVHPTSVRTWKYNFCLHVLVCWQNTEINV